VRRLDKMEGPALLQDSHNNNTRLGSPDTFKMSSADIEQFQGKIVYNPDGSAYIIEDADFSDDETIDLPRQAGRIVEKPGHVAMVDQFPTIENAIYVAKNKSLNNYPSYVRAQTNLSDTRPSVHSYRVYNYRHKSSERGCLEPLAASAHPDNIPVKPILMCFICKLSFGNTKAFKNHCKDDHSLEFNEDEGDMLQLENISALVQLVGKDKEPLLSFLEPVVKGHYTMPSDQVPIRSPSKSPNEAGHIRVRNDLAGPHPRVQVSPVSNGRSSEDSMSPSPSSFNPNGTGFPLKGTTIGACPDHIQGRATGVDCAKCDMILNTNRLGQLGWNASNNACKTLKCPKCNWHYKYQETLEIHMKEKHPDNETTCIYCITGQQHPRLARGETYTCGYKPYRCEICNYSTTTKGNLSIHMQSDKHINNMQEIQNGGQTTPSPSPSQTSQFVTPSGTPNPQDCDKEKPSWRCDVCNYETNIARNLRIHMTSEKHMNNVMNLQQMNLGPNGLPNGESPLPMMSPHHNMPGAPNLSQLLGMSRMPGHPGMPGSPMKEAAMADMAFNQALLMQMMGGQPGMPSMPPGFPGMPFPGMPDQQEQVEPEQADPNPTFLYNCAVCKEFSCDHLQALSDHLAIDRTKLRETEVSLHIGGTYICKLCSYKTNLKANFQLHCKTDKHLQKLQLVNHIMEGGPANEWKLNFMNVSNSVQLRCNACDFYTDSIHKLQIHSANQGHEVSSAIFSHLRKEEQTLKGSERLEFTCAICKHGVAGKALLLQHCRGVKHLQMEQLHLLQLRAEGGGQSPEIGDIFTVSPMVENDSSEQDNRA
jgi:AT-binding transcription factor 1